MIRLAKVASQVDLVETCVADAADALAGRDANRESVGEYGEERMEARSREKGRCWRRSLAIMCV